MPEAEIISKYIIFFHILPFPKQRTYPRQLDKKNALNLVMWSECNIFFFVFYYFFKHNTKTTLGYKRHTQNKEIK